MPEKFQKVRDDEGKMAKYLIIMYLCHSKMSQFRNWERPHNSNLTILYHSSSRIKS